MKGTYHRRVSEEGIFAEKSINVDQHLTISDSMDKFMSIMFVRGFPTRERESCCTIVIIPCTATGRLLHGVSR